MHQADFVEPVVAGWAGPGPKVLSTRRNFDEDLARGRRRVGKRTCLFSQISERNCKDWVASVSAATAPSPAAAALPLAFATSLFAIAPATLAIAAVSAQLAALHPAKRSTLFRMHLWRPAVSSGRAAVVLDPPGAHAHIGCGGAAVPRVCVR